MPNLNTTITSLAETFAKQLVEALRSLSLEEILGAAGTAAPKRTTAPKSAPKAKARAKASATALSVDAIVAILRTHKGGLRAEHLRRELGAPKPAFNYQVGKALAEKRISKRGMKRATTYSVR